MKIYTAINYKMTIPYNIMLNYIQGNLRYPVVSCGNQTDPPNEPVSLDSAVFCFEEVLKKYIVSCAVYLMS